MLVEDDNNLREIYGARLQAEGYEIVSAKDGEEALALAVKEKPDLILCDIMMPKISGFDVLDILRSTPETKNSKVVMMTALSQAEDKSHADKLGADRYLVKSQVTLEDVVRVVKEVMGSGQAAPPSAVAPVPTPSNPPQVPDLTAAMGQTATTTPQPPSPAIADPQPPAPAPEPAVSEPVAPVAPTLSKAEPVTDNSPPAVPMPPPPPDAPISPPVANVPVVTGTPTTITVKDASSNENPPVEVTANDKVLADAVAKVSAEITPDIADEKPAQAETSSVVPNNADRPKSRVIQPLNDINETKTDIHELIAREEAANGSVPTEAGTSPTGVVNPVSSNPNPSP